MSEAREERFGNKSDIHAQIDTNNDSVHVEELQTCSDKESNKEDRLISVLGNQCEVTCNQTTIYENIGQIEVLDGLHQCPHLKSLILTCQKIRVIEGLDSNVELEQLELYQNNIRSIQNVQCLTNLRILDLSFNHIRTIENLDTLCKLEKLFLSSNKIEKIQNINNLIRLNELELGSNRLRVIENLEHLRHLKALWLGKNKIVKMNLPFFPCLKVLSMQSNRLTEWDSSLFVCCPALEELYLSHNALTDIPEALQYLKHLQILDLAGNRISCLKNLSKCIHVKELWLNDNLIRGIDNIHSLTPLTSLSTLYLERNPIQTDTGPGYTQTILSILHWLKQLDALCMSEVYHITNKKES